MLLFAKLEKNMSSNFTQFLKKMHNVQVVVHYYIPSHENFNYQYILEYCNNEVF